MNDPTLRGRSSLRSKDDGGRILASAAAACKVTFCLCYERKGKSRDWAAPHSTHSVEVGEPGSTNLLIADFRIDPSPFFAGVAATLAFFVVFRVLIKPFFWLLSSDFGPLEHHTAQSVQTPSTLNLVLALQMDIGLGRATDRF